ncbi:MAG TPA: hypothetical protein DD687_04150 [Verrucomicrobiales bacterium]|nr:hypothetical protein [Verrucomicrobiales bacterium]
MKSSQICFGTLGTMLEADPSAFPLIDRAMSSQIWKKNGCSPISRQPLYAMATFSLCAVMDLYWPFWKLHGV